MQINCHDILNCWARVLIDRYRTAIFILLLVAVAMLLTTMFLWGRAHQQACDRAIMEAQEAQIERLTKMLERKNKHLYEMEARKIARAYGVDEELVLSIMWQESRFKADARSPVGAYGLMQLMPNTMKDLGLQKDHSWQENIHAGIKYIVWLKERVQTTEQMLIAYNWGIGNLRKYNAGKIKQLPRETANYIEAVKRHIQAKPWRI